MLHFRILYVQQLNLTGKNCLALNLKYNQRVSLAISDHQFLMEHFCENSSRKKFIVDFRQVFKYASSIHRRKFKKFGILGNNNFFSMVNLVL